jgi:hypothetical protein
MMRCTPIIAAALLIVGCGGSEPRLVPVAGKVMIDGKPLAYGTITVVPTNGRPAYGQIGEYGSFSLTTRSLNDGCIAGEHKLEITARRIISAGAWNGSLPRDTPRRRRRASPSSWTNPKRTRCLAQMGRRKAVRRNRGRPRPVRRQRRRKLGRRSSPLVRRRGKEELSDSPNRFRRGLTVRS